MFYIEQIKRSEQLKKIDKFFEFCKNPQEVQLAVLSDILERNKKSELGKKLGFDTIKTADEFKKKVPITEWNFYKDYAQRMEKGEPDIMFSGKPVYFIVTSGTEGGNKFIPESEIGRDIKNLVSELRNLYAMQKYPEVLHGKIIPLANQALIGYTEAGIPIGTASGLTTINTGQDMLDKFSACPMPVKNIQDLLANDYATLRFAAEEDVRGVTGNNVGRLINMVNMINEFANEIIEDIENGTLSEKFNIENDIRKTLNPYLKPNKQRAKYLREIIKTKGKIELNDLWPNLRVIRCWLGGSIGQFAERIKEMLKEYTHKVIFIDAGYGASEGKFNIPLEDNTPSAPVAHFSAFYEFIEVDKETQDTKFLWELEDGKEYRIIITTYSGLYRYDLHDIIKVNGFTHNTPNIEFISKISDIANISGEKLSSKFLVDIFSKATEITNFKIKHFCVVADIKTSRYEFYVEPAEENTNYRKLIETVDKLLIKLNKPYETLRGQNLLEKPRIIKMKKGWQEFLQKNKAKSFSSISQVKLPVVCKKKPDKEWIEKEF